MRVAGAVLVLSMTLWPAIGQAQTAQKPARVATPAAAEAKTHPVAAAAAKNGPENDPKNDPKKKGAAAPRDVNGGVALADRALIQFDLAWIGAYNGLITGEANDKTTGR